MNTLKATGCHLTTLLLKLGLRRFNTSLSCHVYWLLNYRKMTNSYMLLLTNKTYEKEGYVVSFAFFHSLYLSSSFVWLKLHVEGIPSQRCFIILSQLSSNLSRSCGTSYIRNLYDACTVLLVLCRWIYDNPNISVIIKMAFRQAMKQMFGVSALKVLM